MRTLVVADIHANLPAFEAVIEDAARGGAIDSVWSMGDIVGYGPEPSACIALLRSYPHRAIAGNHDLAAVRRVSAEVFNPAAKAAVLWNAEQLSFEERAYLLALPLTLTDSDFTLVHGSLADPVWEYLVWPEVARFHFSLQLTPFCLVGHSHIPLVFYADEPERGDRAFDGEQIELGERRFVANPGSVGQPRDGDPRAAYAILDDEARRLSFHRVVYDVALTQKRMRAAGLPRNLSDRLVYGH